MACIFNPKSMAKALEYVRQVQTKLAGDDSKTYDQFFQILKQFRRRNLDSSDVVATVEKLFHNHPDLLHAFRTFVPINPSSSTAAADDSDLTACVDFLNRLGTRFAGNGVYSKFLDCMTSHSRGEITASEVCDKIFGLLGKHEDLVEEFRFFLPESCNGERSKKRKIDCDEEFRPQRPGKKRDQNPTRQQQRIISKNKEMDFEMEDLLCEVDVKIGNLTSTYTNAVKLVRRLSSGRLSPADVRLDKHFTPLNLACIRDLSRKRLDNAGNPEYAMLELMNILMKKKEALEKSRVKILEKWIKIRRSRHSHEVL